MGSTNVTQNRPLVLNFCVTDGRSIAANRHARHVDDIPSLHYSVDDARNRAILASECLSEELEWHTVDPGSFVTVGSDLDVRTQTRL